MLMNAKSIIFVATFTFLFAGCQESVFQSLKKTNYLFVYEGLPHPLRENPSFKKEKSRNDVMQIEDHWFYDAKVKTTGNTRDQLMNLLFDESGFSSNMLPADCGPFHPDYAIMWESDGVENYLMICYTCGEAKLIQRGKVKIYAINAYKMESLVNLLAEFKANRPW